MNKASTVRKLPIFSGVF